jgi:hypothetical protein
LVLLLDLPRHRKRDQDPRRSGPFPLPDFTRIIEINLIDTFSVIRWSRWRPGC